MNISIVGIDIAKNVFQLHAVDNTGNVKLTNRSQANSKLSIDLRLAGARHLLPFRKRLRAKLAVMRCTN